ncbi:MAG: DUF4831 family protein [Marinilabiliaceae bacterium]|nr:DUF4831 family protein [Marinilabiliaceae bacterium]
MFRRILVFIFFVLAYFPFEAFAKDDQTIVVTPVSQDADAANGGIIYALPKTVFRVRIDAQLTIEKAGPFYKYSNKYLNLTDVITQDSKSWKIVSASVEAISVPDFSNRYKISATPTAIFPSVILNRDGILCGINTSKSLKEVGPLSDVKVTDSYLSFDDIQLDQSVLTKTSTAAMAEQAAQAIYRLREKRLAILGGEESTILSDAGSYDRVLSELDRIEKEHVSLFIGKKQVFTETRYFEVVPDPQGEMSMVVVRFSEKEGFVDAMNLAGKPIYMDWSFNTDSHVNQYPEGSKQRKNAPVIGLRYIIPAQVDVKILDRNILIAEKTLYCTQGGQVASLPASILSQPNVKIEFDPITGSLLSIKSGSKESNDNTKKR